MKTFFNRHLNILDYAIGNLWRGRFRSVSILVVFTITVFMVASFSLLSNSLRSAAVQLLETVPEIIVQKLEAGRQVGISIDEIPKLDTIYGISEINPRIWGYYFDEINGANYTVIGDPRFGRDQLIPGLPLEMSSPEKLNPAISPAVVGTSFVQSRRVGQRSNFSLFRPDLSLKSFRIVGSFSERSSMVTADLLVTTIEDARDLFQIQANQVTDLLVSVANPSEVNVIAGKIDKILAGSRVITRNQIQKTYQVAFGWRSGVGLICMLGAVTAFAILAWDRASSLSPDEAREVALMKMVGWQTSDVMLVRFWESAVLSTISFGLGYMAAWIHVLFFKGALFLPILLGWSVLKPPVVLVPVFRFSDLLLIGSLTIFPYLAATIIPAWRSGTVKPDALV